jgi:hypothetical protein
MREIEEKIYRARRIKGGREREYFLVEMNQIEKIVRDILLDMDPDNLRWLRCQTFFFTLQLV